jgi:hypothetical protein
LLFWVVHCLLQLHFVFKSKDYLIIKMNKTPITCGKCTYYFTTHDASKPWGCSKFRFKSKNLPNHEVRQATGMDCAYFTLKQFIKSTERRSNGN